MCLYLLHIKIGRVSRLLSRRFWIAIIPCELTDSYWQILELIGFDYLTKVVATCGLIDIRTDLGHTVSRLTIGCKSIVGSFTDNFSPMIARPKYLHLGRKWWSFHGISSKIFVSMKKYTLLSHFAIKTVDFQI